MKEWSFATDVDFTQGTTQINQLTESALKKKSLFI